MTAFNATSCGRAPTALAEKQRGAAEKVPDRLAPDVPRRDLHGSRRASRRASRAVVGGDGEKARLHRHQSRKLKSEPGGKVNRGERWGQHRVAQARLAPALLPVRPVLLRGEGRGVSD